MLLKKSYQLEINEFCKQLTDENYKIKSATKGALTQARKKLNPWAFKRLNEVVVDTFYNDVEISVWHGFRLLAVDGSTLRLPSSKEIREEFGAPGYGMYKESNTCIARCSMLHDVLNHITIDSQIAPITEGEISLLNKHYPKLEKKDLLLGDRYYGTFETMYQLQQKEINYCFRLKDILKVKEFKQSESKDEIVELKLSKKTSEKCNGAKYIKCRLIKVKTEKGEVQVLGTSLFDNQKYPYEDLSTIYELRWEVEEAYKLLKSRIELEAFSGKTVRSVRQDFHAKVFMMTLCAAMSYPIDQKIKEEYKADKTGNKYDQKINRTNALGTIKINLVKLFFNLKRNKIFNFITKVLEKGRVLIRKQRSYVRKKTRKKSKIFSVNYKRI